METIVVKALGMVISITITITIIIWSWSWSHGHMTHFFGHKLFQTVQSSPTELRRGIRGAAMMDKVPAGLIISCVQADHELLVGGIPTRLKHMSQFGLLFPTEWNKTKFMFQTTNQINMIQPLQSSCPSTGAWALTSDTETRSELLKFPSFPRC